MYYTLYSTQCTVYHVRVMHALKYSYIYEYVTNTKCSTVHYINLLTSTIMYECIENVHLISY